MQPEDRIIVAAAIERLVSLHDSNGESAEIIISTFHGMKKILPISFEFKGVKKGGSVEGMTEHGNMSVEDNDQPVHKLYGYNYERVGKWMVWMDDNRSSWFEFGKHVIWFRDFLSQETGSSRDTQYFLKYDTKTLQPIAFGHVGDRELLFSIGNFYVWRDTIIISLGETKMPRAIYVGYSSH